MYAVIQTGGKQYRVAQGSRLRVEKIEAEADTSIELDRVLMVAGERIEVGTPYIEGGKVTATVKAHGRAKKVKIIKLKRRKHYLKHQGHRQYYTLLEITGINAAGMTTPPFATEILPESTSDTTTNVNSMIEEVIEEVKDGT